MVKVVRNQIVIRNDLSNTMSSVVLILKRCTTLRTIRDENIILIDDDLSFFIVMT